ncbi:MAG TPA: Asp23/Gls24 family envelope stress response protein [Arthrobacter sp.]|nr:Asp23/Gls24 family envelope stress response protein [Arthrobacter sp.]
MSMPNDTFECGHTLEELSLYLDTGEFADPAHLESCPECRNGLDSLRRLSAAGGELFASDLAAAGTGTDDWMKAILANLALELRPGRSIPLRSEDPADTLSQTEGAVLALVRSVADNLPGAVAGKVRIDGDVTVPGAPVAVRLDLAVLFGQPLVPSAASLRQDLAAALARHTELNVSAIDITITDVIEAPREEA